MADRLTCEQRSRHMARIRSTATRAEEGLRAQVRALGLRVARGKGLPGTPDIVLRDARVAVFMHGCFWHGCPRHYRAPQSRLEYWSSKLERNRRRDARVARALRKAGWSVLTVWECQVLGKDSRYVARIAATAARRAALTPPPASPRS
ncbi:MAG TPA: DNA mismatch endonuclease Vsr [Candidatus Thermoplasmatota archaeon]|nr:DNA mismatch endonuclease Vsr [Candidatus Thermoplasmatota archaeon]